MSARLRAAEGAFGTEMDILAYALLSWRRGLEVPEGAQGFTYHRRSGIVGLLVAVVLVCGVELVVVHLVLRAWSPRAAWTLTALSILGVIWIIGLGRAMVLRPILVESGRVVIRSGLLWALEVPTQVIARVDRSRGGAPDRRAPAHLQVAPVGQPNLLLTLTEPVEARGVYGRTKRVATVALTLDDPAGFCAVLERAGWRPG